MSYFDVNEDKFTGIPKHLERRKTYRRDKDTMQKALDVLRRIERHKQDNSTADMLIRDCGVVIILLNRELKALEDV